MSMMILPASEPRERSAGTASAKPVATMTRSDPVTASLAATALAPGSCLRRFARGDSYLVASPGELLNKGRAHVAGAENRDVHDVLLLKFGSVCPGQPMATSGLESTLLATHNVINILLCNI
jgi:hypothetical protein